MSNRKRNARFRDATTPAAVWREKENFDGKVVNAGVVILRTSGCSHYHGGGCSMCGYNTESTPGVTSKNIEEQFRKAAEQLGDNTGFLKVYTSGSFLDECEVSKESAKAIAKFCAETGQRLLFETRPEYATDDALESISEVNDDIEVALGLESSNDTVLKASINKGFTFKDYREAAVRIRNRGLHVRTYVLLKPPFLSESEAIADSKNTIRQASGFSEAISLNPVNVQSGTLVEKLWKNWSYRSPWLWSVLDVLKSCQGLRNKIVCDPTGGGRERGAHNCGKCDEVILDSIKNFSLTQDFERLGEPACECHSRWESVLALEDSAMGGSPDLQRFFRMQRA